MAFTKQYDDFVLGVRRGPKESWTLAVTYQGQDEWRNLSDCRIQMKCKVARVLADFRDEYEIDTGKLLVDAVEIFFGES